MVAAGDAAGGVDEHDLGDRRMGVRQDRLGAALLEQPVEPDAAAPQRHGNLGAAAGALESRGDRFGVHGGR